MRCHSCGSEDLRAFYEVSQIPVHSCLMVATREEARAFPRGDLRLDLCRSCGFIQNVLFDPDVQSYNTDYEETQSFSNRFREFSTRLCANQIEKYGLRGKRILEIGCGKGEFLVEICEMGENRGIGIDPGYRPERTESAAASRIEFIQDLYSEKYTHLTADYVCCRHTLEHIQPVRQFVQMIRDTLVNRPHTVVFFELPDVARVLKESAFWDVYYEHCTYFTLGSLARLFRACKFELLDLYKVYDGQYLMIEARPAPESDKETSKGRSLGDRAHGEARSFEAEDDLEQTIHDVEVFETQVADRLAQLRSDLQRVRDCSQKAVIWGSGSKAVSFLTTLGISRELEYVVDINPHKHGKFLAGTGHEIVGPGFLKTYLPDVVFIMNPIYVDEIRSELNRMNLRPKLIPL